MPLDDAQWNELARDLRRAWARVAPEWSDAPVHDPGLTVLELLAYALTDLAFHSAALDERGRRLAARVAGCAAALAASPVAPARDAPCQAPCAARPAPPGVAEAGGDAAVPARPTPLERALAESLEQQAASVVILRAILDSPAAARPAFEALLAHALRSCDADLGTVAVAEGGRLVPSACAGCTREDAAALLRGLETNAPTADRPTAPADLAAASPRRPVEATPVPGTQASCEDVRAVLAVPMRDEGARLGLVALARREARPFTGPQRQRLQALAEHAALAVEHVRRVDALRRAEREG